mgnify:CR=1 FL=1
MKTIVTALPGTGKTTTLKKLAELMPSISVVNYGDLMFEEASRIYGVRHRDEMRNSLGLREYQRLQILAAKHIAGLDGDIVVDTHSVIKTGFGYYPGLPVEGVNIIRPDLVVYIECRPEDVVERRMRDIEAGVGRVREVAGVEEVAYDQDIGRMFVVSAANAAMCYLKIIRLTYPQQYMFQHAEDAAKQIAETISEISRRGRKD